MSNWLYTYQQKEILAELHDSAGFSWYSMSVVRVMVPVVNPTKSGHKTRW